MNEKLESLYQVYGKENIDKLISENELDLENLYIPKTYQPPKLIITY